MQSSRPPLWNTMSSRLRIVGRMRYLTRYIGSFISKHGIFIENCTPTVSDSESPFMFFNKNLFGTARRNNQSIYTVSPIKSRIKKKHQRNKIRSWLNPLFIASSIFFYCRLNKYLVFTNCPLYPRWKDERDKKWKEKREEGRNFRRGKARVFGGHSIHPAPRRIIANIARVRSM